MAEIDTNKEHAAYEAQSAALALAEGALKKLADKLDEINASSEFQGVWSMFIVRGGVYRGPNWSEALANARNTLAAIDKLKGTGEKEAHKLVYDKERHTIVRDGEPLNIGIDDTPLA